MNRRVVFEVPEPVWGRLASRADDLGVKVADLLSGAVTNLVPGDETDRVVRLARLGLSDKEIARAMELTNAQVARRRRLGGVPANRWASRKDVA